MLRCSLFYLFRFIARLFVVFSCRAIMLMLLSKQSKHSELSPWTVTTQINQVCVCVCKLLKCIRNLMLK